MARPTAPERLWTGALLVLLVASFVVRMRAAWPDPLAIDLDTDEILALAHDARQGGGWLAPGHAVTPTRIRLGPLWHDEVALALRLSGDDLKGAWRLLVGLDLVGLLVATLALARTIGRPAALAFAAVLLSDPLVVLEQHWPFWYQQHLVSWVAPAAAAWVALAAGGGAGALLAGAVLTGLSVQLHAMAWTLLPVAVAATWVARSRLRGADVAVGGLAFAVAAWPMVRQLPALARPEAWTAMATLRADPAVHGDPWHALASTLVDLPARLTGGPVLAVAALAVALAGARRGPVERGIAIVVAAWAVAAAAIFALVAHRWHVHYGLVLLVPLALAVAALARAASGWRPAAAAALVVAVGLRPALPFSWDFVPPPPIVWEAVGPRDRAVEAFAAAGVTAPGLARVHGLPCAWPGVCALRTLQDALTDAGGRAEDDGATHLVRWSWEEGPVVRPYDGPVARRTPAADGVEVTVDGGAPGWLHVVALGEGPLTLPSDARRFDVDLPGDRPLVVLARPLVPAGPTSLVAPAGYRVVDAFVVDRPWTADDLGLTTLTPGK